MALPEPELTPPLLVWDGMIRIFPAPIWEMERAMELEEPFPISVIAITAAIPITIPRVVSRERVGFRRNARNAKVNVEKNLMIESSRLKGGSRVWHNRQFPANV